MDGPLSRSVLLVLSLIVGPAAASAAAGQTPEAAPQPVPPLTLQAALAQARANSQQLRLAQTAAGIAMEDRVQARAALLPSLSGFGQYIYTEPNGTPSGVFIANDGPHV